jgi:nucleoside-diphosphate-sugar epimerase
MHVNRKKQRRMKMTKPKILVTSAAGRTGAPTVMELLANGYPVRAFVRRRDARAEALERAGAELFIGDMFDYRDVSMALDGVQRAYHCAPIIARLSRPTCFTTPPFLRSPRKAQNWKWSRF